MEGIEGMGAEREGKVTLKSFEVEEAPLPVLKPKEIRATREKLNVSQAVFAVLLQLNKRTLERWEQGTAKPNAQASLLIRMVSRHPELIEQIRETRAALSKKRRRA
ncbi:MAG: type II toxin-antitoxin system MqsA family antitoxin [Deltaproteobacteria bacterium]|nr:type II toxin-antitoxin system MqsA family antitoxin [Deltaproteobacteria bacterium]